MSVDIQTESTATGDETVELVNRHRNNPVINGSNREWIDAIVREDGRYYAFVSLRDGANPPNRWTELYYGDSLDNLSAYSGNPITASGAGGINITDVFVHDGRYFGIGWDQDTNDVHLLYASEPHDWTVYSGDPVETGSRLAWTTTSDPLHPDGQLDYGRFRWSMTTKSTSPQQEGAWSSDTVAMASITDNGVIITQQAAWEDPDTGGVTNVTPRILDGMYRAYYSAGPSGTDRDLGVRWGQTVRDFDTNYFDEALVVANGSDHESNYINIGTFGDGILIYYGHGDMSTGQATNLLQFSYANLSEVRSPRIEVRVYEDTNQDGTAENEQVATQSVGSDTSPLSRLSGGTGNDYWVDVTLLTEDPKNGVEVTSVGLDT